MLSVKITTGARLHFGPLSVSSPGGGRFGGVGLMIQQPGMTLTAHEAKTDSIEGDPEISVRIAEFLARIRENSHINVPPCRIRVERTIPAHHGFGSGTQHALAVARAISILSGESGTSIAELARRTGRGMRSAIGLYGFEYGGFLVDGGRSDVGRLGTLVSRVDFPNDWRLLLASPRRAAGLSGESEQLAFAQQSAMTLETTGHLCRIVLMDWLPAVMTIDFARCAAAMSDYGDTVGQFFAKAQGGIFSDARMAEWSAVLRRRGIQGVAQTSWGPTAVALVENQSTGEQLQRDFAHDTNWSDCRFDLTAALNHGAIEQVL